MRYLAACLRRLPGFPEDESHPAQVALRTYSLSLSLSLGPSLLPFILTRILPRSNRSNKYNGHALLKVLRRELGYDGFAFAMTLAVGGGEALRRHLSSAAHRKRDAWFQPPRILLTALSKLTSVQRTFIANLLSSAVAMILIQSGRHRSLRLRSNPHSIDAIPFTLSTPRSSRSVQPSSPTLDLTFLLLVRAVDALIQTLVFTRSQTHRPSPSRRKSTGLVEPEAVRERLLQEPDDQARRNRLDLTSRIDAVVFWSCSARIMWCFFYQPERLPFSYVKWIGSLASVDERLLNALRSLRAGSWSYISGSANESHLVTSLSGDLGYPSAWGDPSLLPAYGGKVADTVWSRIGVNGRPGVGGIPCEIVHGGTSSRFGLDASCVANATVRGMYAFAEAMAIYLPVHILPVLITRPKALLQLHNALSTLLGAIRSAAFLSTFVASYWFAVCSTRTLALAKLFPFVSHDFWDGPYGCIMAGCLACGSSIWIENGKRRGEMALYVLPRALRSCLPNSWSGHHFSRVLERLVFATSFACLITSAIHQSDSLRGLSRWAVAFVLKGPNAGFWKRQRLGQGTSLPPSLSATPYPASSDPKDDSNSDSQT